MKIAYLLIALLCIIENKDDYYVFDFLNIKMFGMEFLPRIMVIGTKLW